jgi:hypothetical protein
MNKEQWDEAISRFKAITADTEIAKLVTDGKIDLTSVFIQCVSWAPKKPAGRS